MNIYTGIELWLHSVSTSAPGGNASAPRHALAALPPGKELWYPLIWRQGGAQSQSGEKEMISDQDSNSDTNPYVTSVVTTQTRLRWDSSTAVGLQECTCSACDWKNYGETRKGVLIFARSAGNQRGYSVIKSKSTVSSEKPAFPVVK
jgi:hypothetical protein